MKSIAFATLLMSALALVAGCVGAPKVVAPDPGTTAAGEPAGDAAQEGGAVSDVAGNWQASWTAADGSHRQGAMLLKQNGSELSGSFQGKRGSASLKGSLRGNQVSLTMQLPRGPVSLTGTIDGDKMSGTTDQGVSWTAIRE